MSKRNASAASAAAFDADAAATNDDDDDCMISLLEASNGVNPIIRAASISALEAGRIALLS